MENFILWFTSLAGIEMFFVVYGVLYLIKLVVLTPELLKLARFIKDELYKEVSYNYIFGTLFFTNVLTLPFLLPKYIIKEKFKFFFTPPNHVTERAIQALKNEKGL